MPTHPCVFFLVTLLIIHPAPAPAQAHSHSKCNESFHCGHLGTLQFPFTEIHNSQCGLFLLNCTSSPHPLIQFGSGGAWLQFLFNNASANKARVLDPNLNMTMLDPGKCLPVGSPYNNSPPFPLALFSIHPHITVVYCPKYLIPPSDHDPFPAGFKYNPYCDAFDLYYGDVEIEGTTDIPQNCSVVHLPTRTTPGPHGSDQPLQQLSQEYEVEWRVSPACNFSCYLGGGTCLVNATTQQVNCDGAVTDQQKPKDEGDQQKAKDERDPLPRKVIIVAGTIMALISATIVLFLTTKYWLHKFSRLQKLEKAESQNAIELFLHVNGNLAPRRYKYSDLKKMTNSFAHKLGKGGYGCVYKGKLPNDGRLVAVKILNEVTASGEGFINEVASISRTSHVNIVTLLGYCIEGSKRALIYEFMPNGSLDMFIQNNAASPSVACGLGWDKLLDIAIGTARGLEYLHLGCNMRILHFDIKPHNILLDRDFNPKISDFGLAKLCPNRSSLVSMLVARGTIGYIAPEVFCRNFGRVSHKSDVYSYGMMVMEMVVGRQNPDNQADHSSEMYFPDWIYKHLEMKSGVGFLDNIMNEDEGQLARKMIIVGLWCIQTEPKNRPPMNKVVEMLIGDSDCLEIPPLPNVASVPIPALESPSTFDTSIIQHDA